MRKVRKILRVPVQCCECGSIDFNYLKKERFNDHTGKMVNAEMDLKEYCGIEFEVKDFESRHGFEIENWIGCVKCDYSFQALEPVSKMNRIFAGKDKDHLFKNLYQHMDDDFYEKEEN